MVCLRESALTGCMRWFRFVGELAMSEGKRPGGLTALAVINFVWGGLQLLVILGLATMIGAVYSPEFASEIGLEQQAEAMGERGVWILWLVLGLTCVIVFLLIASGVGYLKQKKFLGRLLGTAYAVLSIVISVLGAVLTPAEAGDGFELDKAVGIIYPALTLVLLNTTFKHDFIR